jgi:hypothetical protein
MGLMNDHGLVIMVVELVVLGALTFAAIGTDEYWTRRAEDRESGVGDRRSVVAGQRSDVGRNKP